jgi:outer membrane murein-binding lipoprotein Lpp
MINKTNKIVAAVIVVLLIIIGLQQCSINKKDKEISDNQEWVKYYNSTVDSLKNKLNQTVVEAQVAKVNNEKEIKKLSETVFNLKESDERHVKQVNALIRVMQNFKLDTTLVAYHDTVEVDKNDSSLVPRNKVIVPPRDFVKTTENYQINGTVLLEGVRINSLVIPDTSSIRIVEKKTNFFKRRETVIQTIHTNPYYHNDKIQAVVKQGERPSRWQKWIKPLLTGIAGAFLTYKVVK